MWVRGAPDASVMRRGCVVFAGRITTPSCPTSPTCRGLQVWASITCWDARVKQSMQGLSSRGTIPLRAGRQTSRNASDSPRSPPSCDRIRHRSGRVHVHRSPMRY
eukprot:1245476-Prymnesium_polylepis.1